MVNCGLVRKTAMVFEIRDTEGSPDRNLQRTVKGQASEPVNERKRLISTVTRLQSRHAIRTLGPLTSIFLPFYPVRLIDKTSDSVSPKAVRVQKSGETNLRLSHLSHPFCRNTFALK